MWTWWTCPACRGWCTRRKSAGTPWRTSTPCPSHAVSGTGGRRVNVGRKACLASSTRRARAGACSALRVVGLVDSRAGGLVLTPALAPLSLCPHAGTPVTVKVLDVEPNRCRVALSIKQLTPDPLKQTLDTVRALRQPGTGAPREEPCALGVSPSCLPLRRCARSSRGGPPPPCRPRCSGWWTAWRWTRGWRAWWWAARPPTPATCPRCDGGARCVQCWADAPH